MYNIISLHCTSGMMSGFAVHSSIASVGVLSKPCRDYLALISRPRIFCEVNKILRFYIHCHVDLRQLIVACPLIWWIATVARATPSRAGPLLFRALSLLLPVGILLEPGLCSLRRFRISSMLLYHSPVLSSSLRTSRLALSLRPLNQT